MQVRVVSGYFCYFMEIINLGMRLLQKKFKLINRDINLIILYVFINLNKFEIIVVIVKQVILIFLLRFIKEIE